MNDGWHANGSSTTASTITPGITVRFGSARITDSSTISSHTTITRSAANAASFWQPSRPQICASPLASARCACTIATSGFSGGTTWTSVASSYGETMERMFGFTFGMSDS